jgi:hypothetical protein
VTMATRNLYGSGGRRMGSAGAPCVFISYRSSDRIIAVAVAAAFDSAGLEYYLDVADAGLQAASVSGASDAVVKCIEHGLRRSTHLIGIVTETTRDSWWVPFEIGASRALASASGVTEPDHRIAYLVDPNVTGLPDYMKVSDLISSQSDLAAWISRLIPPRDVFEERQIRTASARAPGALPATRAPLRFYRR